MHEGVREPGTSGSARISETLERRDNYAARRSETTGKWRRPARNVTGRTAQLLAEGQILQGQRGPSPNQATLNEKDGPEHGPPRLPWMMDLVANGLREYAGQVPETQAWHGG